ncbi:MAG: hypothetical protein JRF33_03800 [Deltaproteobacteria bacterium]|nr:hypothetical protein [Deltaproteobacteria bacterium]
MKKKMSIVLAIVLSMSLAVVAINCGGDDDDPECTAGTLNCECAADSACDGDLVCNASNVCEAAAGGCCDDVEGMIEVSGTVTDLTQTPAAVAVTALSAFHVMTGAPTPLGTTTSAADGSFTIDCFDVSGAALGLVLLTGEAGSDFFPTLTGVAAYSDDADKVCIESTPPVWALPTAFVSSLDAHPLITTADGIVIGFIVSAAGAPIEGATVMQGDGNPVDGTVIYPNADFSDFTGTATSATGIYMIPAPLALVTLTAEATGHTFATDLYKAAAVAGHAYMVSMQAE